MIEEMLIRFCILLIISLLLKISDRVIEKVKKNSRRDVAHPAKF